MLTQLCEITPRSTLLIHVMNYSITIIKTSYPLLESIYFYKEPHDRLFNPFAPTVNYGDM